MGCCFRKPMKETNIDDNLKIEKTDVTILYVEDCEMYMPLMKFIFSKYCNNINLDLIWRKNIQDAHDYIKNNPIDLIFLDRELKDGEMGDDLVDIIFKEKIFDLNKIIIISSLENVTDIQKYLDMGVYYFKKPIDIEIFITKIKNIFR